MRPARPKTGQAAPVRQCIPELLVEVGRTVLGEPISRCQMPARQVLPHRIGIADHLRMHRRRGV